MDKLKSILFKAQSNKKTNWLLSKNVLEKAIKEFPNEKQIYLELAELLNSKKSYSEAIKNYQKALVYDKNNRDILFKIGTCFLNLDEFPLALDYYNQINDDFPELIYNKAFALSKIDKIDQSIEYLKELIEKGTSNDVPYLFLSELYYTQGFFKKSIEILEKAERIFGKKGAIFFIKGSAYSQMKNWLQAVYNYSQADKLNFIYPNFHRNYAVALEKIGHVDRAIEMIKKNLEYNSEDVQSYFHIITLYIVKYDYKNAKEYIEKAKKLTNLTNQAYLNLLEKRISPFFKSEE